MRTKPKRGRKKKAKPAIPAWALLPDSNEAIERGERRAPIPPREPGIVAQLRATMGKATA